jgi:hypothetical protein
MVANPWLLTLLLYEVPVLVDFCSWSLFARRLFGYWRPFYALKAAILWPVLVIVWTWHRIK